MSSAEGTPTVEAGGSRYAWIEQWAELPASDSRQAAWPHTAIALTDDGEIITFDQAERSLIALRNDGRPLRSSPVDIDEAHGMTFVVDGGVPFGSRMSWWRMSFHIP